MTHDDKVLLAKCCFSVFLILGLLTFGVYSFYMETSTIAEQFNIPFWKAFWLKGTLRVVNP